MKFRTLFILAVFGSTLFFAGTAGAQGVGIPNNGSFDIELSPEFPRPLQEVTAKIISGSFNVDGAAITWVLNGKVQLEGVGKRNLTFTTGEAGSAVSLRVEINTDDFGLLSKEFEVRPSDVDILWEADTYTPPFYKGKALPTSQSYIKMVGVPNFVGEKGNVDPKNLIYSWKKTYTPNPDDSGIGKNIYLYRGTYTFNSNTIETVVSTTDGALAVSKKTKVSIYEPKILFYERKPLEGIRYENSLGGLFNMKEKEVTLRAEPYFFSFINPDNNGAVFAWRLDGKKLEVNPDKKAEFTLRKPDTGSGSAGISIGIENSGYDLQKASKNISLSYTN